MVSLRFAAALLSVSSLGACMNWSRDTDGVPTSVCHYDEDFNTTSDPRCSDQGRLTSGPFVPANAGVVVGSTLALSTGSAVLSVDLLTGNSTLVSGTAAESGGSVSLGTGVNFVAGHAIQVGADGGFYVAATTTTTGNTAGAPLIVRVEPGTGTRTTFIDLTQVACSSGPLSLTPDIASGFALANDGTVYMTATSTAGSGWGIVALGRAQCFVLSYVSADGAEISSNGPAWHSSLGAVELAADGTLWASDVAENLMFAIDPATGTRRVLSDPQTSDGSIVGIAPGAFSLVSGAAWFLGSSSGHNAILRIDLATGDRTTVPLTYAGQFVGSAVDPTRPLVYGFDTQGVLAVNTVTGNTSYLSR